jgi:HK97 family phage portal protein
MGFWDRFRSKAAPPLGLATMSAMQEAPSRAAMRMIETSDENPWLSAVTSKIAMAVGSAEWYTARKGREDKPSDTPAMRAFGSPNPWMSGAQCWGMAQSHLDLAGEAFVYVERSRTGKPVYFWPLLPDWVHSVPSPMGGGDFEVHADTGGLVIPRQVPADDMLWMRRPSAANPYGRGPGMAHSLADELDTDEQIARYTRAFFFNDARPGGIVSLEGAGADAARVFKHQLNAAHRGVDNSHQIMVTGSKIDFKAIESAIKDLRSTELRQFERDTVIQRFGIPPELLGVLTSSNRATIEAAAYLFARWVVVPRLDARCDDVVPRVFHCGRGSRPRGLRAETGRRERASKAPASAGGGREEKEHQQGPAHSRRHRKDCAGY